MTQHPMVHDLPFGEGAGAPNLGSNHVTPAPLAKGASGLTVPTEIPPNAEQAAPAPEIPAPPVIPGYKP